MTLMESIGNALGRMTQALQRPRSPNNFSPVGAVEKPGHQEVFVGQDPWLSGGLPLTPKDPDGTPPRRWQYPPGFNIQISPRSTEAINFAQLRGLAEYTIVRVIIEHLKTSLQAHEWDIVSTNREDGNSYEADITEVKRFLEKPDGEHEWIEWLNEVVEERLVTDAVTIYPRMTYGGKLASLDLIDGSSIKVLCDTRGFLPMPPYPAYQQFLYGVPKTWYTQEELMYLPGNRRVNKFYGFSPTEQLVITINQGIRRELYNLAAWTDGNTPAGIATLPKEWGLEKIKQFAEYFDELLRGNAQQRSKIFWAPEGSSLQKFKEEESYNLHNKFDEWVARVCCFAYGVSPIPFISMTNRSVAEELGDVEAEGGAAALKMYIERVMNKIIKKYMRKPWLSWNWITDRGRTQAKIVESNKAKVMCGVMQVDEWRIEEGKKPLGLPPGYPTPSGYVLFPKKPEEVLLEPQVQQPVAEGGTVAMPPVFARSATALKRMRDIELDKYERWALKRGEEKKPRRGFKPEFLSEDEVEGIEQELNWEDEDDLDQDMENVVRDRIRRTFQSRRNGGKEVAPGRKG